MALTIQGSAGLDRSIEGPRSASDSRFPQDARRAVSGTAATVKDTGRTTSIDSRSTTQVGNAVVAYITQVARAGLEPAGIPGAGEATPVVASPRSVTTGSAVPTIRPIDMLAALFGAAAPAVKSSNAASVDPGQTATASQDRVSSALQQAIRAYAQDSDAPASSRAG